jgi:hypothetical protein
MSLLHEELARARWHDAQRQQLLRGRTATVVAARKGQRRHRKAPAGRNRPERQRP